MAPRHSPALAMIYDREKQKGNANRATLAVARNWWRTWSRWIAAKRFSGDRERKLHCHIGSGESGDFLQHAACQALLEQDWATELKFRRPTLICFEAGRRSQTQSSVEAHGLRQQMDVWF